MTSMLALHLGEAEYLQPGWDLSRPTRLVLTAAVIQRVSSVRNVESFTFWWTLKSSYHLHAGSYINQVSLPPRLQVGLATVRYWWK